MCLSVTVLQRVEVICEVLHRRFGGNSGRSGRRQGHIKGEREAENKSASVTLNFGRWPLVYLDECSAALLRLSCLARFFFFNESQSGSPRLNSADPVFGWRNRCWISANLELRLGGQDAPVVIYLDLIFTPNQTDVTGTFYRMHSLVFFYRVKNSFVFPLSTEMPHYPRITNVMYNL